MTDDAIVNTASTAWHVIESNKPSSSLVSNTCNAVPAGADPNSLTQVQGPNSVVWRLCFRNHLSVNVVDVRFDLRWEYGARYDGGGAFIPNCYLYVPDCTVLWGYTVDINVHAYTPSNAGTDTAPVACLPITVHGTMKSLVDTRDLQWDFVLYGDGRYTVS